MELFNNLIFGFTVALTLQNLWFCFIGVFLGTLIGVLPGIGPVLLLVSILTMTGYFQLFAEPYVMTEGGPLQATYSVLYFMFEEGFKWWGLGRASAVAFLLFILMFLVTMVQLRLGRERSDA